MEGEEGRREVGRGTKGGAGEGGRRRKVGVRELERGRWEEEGWRKGGEREE